MAVGDSSTDVDVQDDGKGRVEIPTRRQLRLQRVDGRAVAPDPDPYPADRKGPEGSRPPLPGGRRARRQQAETGALARVASETDARAASPSIAEDAEEHLAGLQAAGADDPFAVDPAVLAQQKALAARAAALNARARRTQEVPEQTRLDMPSPTDPAAAHNLSFITPPEFVRAPGSTQSVLRAPRTSSIPVVLPRPERADGEVPGPTAGPAEGAPAETDTEPVGARDAFGLDPLDAVTAGLGRLRRVRYLQYSVLVVGATALVTGIMMTVSSLNG